ncbi:hypothetical protein VTN02DRAFT_6792 [Thermoascus thermophilus]
MRLIVELACGVSVEVAAAARLREVVRDLRPDSRVVVVVCGGSNITTEMISEYRSRLKDGWGLSALTLAGLGYGVPDR